MRSRFEMAAVPDPPAAADHDVPHRIGVAGEHQAVEQRFAAAAGEQRVVGVEPHQVGAAARREAADPAAERLGAAGKRRLPQPGAAMGLGLARGDQAAQAAQALAVLEPAQLLDRADRDVAVGADAERGRRPSRKAARSNRPSPRLASVVGHRPATAPLCASAAVSSSSMWVAWIRHQRASTGAGSSSHSRPGAAPHQARQSSHLLGLLGDVDVDRRRRSIRRAARRTSRSASSGTARSECGATPSRAVRVARDVAPAAARAAARSRRDRGGSGAGPAPAAAPPKPPAHVQHRQQRQADAGSRAAPPGSPATSRPGRRRAARRGSWCR